MLTTKSLLSTYEVLTTTQASWGLSLDQQVQLAADAVIDMYCLGACDVFLAAAHRHARK